MQIEFDSSFQVQGCEIVNYLLEKSRVVYQSKDERNYHMFYQLLATTDPNYRTNLYLKSMKDYYYLSQSGCYEIKDVNDEEEFNEVLKSMVTLEFSTETTFEMFSIISVVLTLGNLQFVAGASDPNSGNDF